MNFFDKLNSWIRGTEASLVNFLSAFVPWLAPLAPAYLSYRHMTEDLGFPIWVSLAVAFVVEGLGLSTVSTAMAFWSHNKKYTSDQRRAPVIVPVAAFTMYLVTIVTLNVLMEVAKIPAVGWDVQWVRVGAYFLLAMLSVPAAVTLATRTQHKELIDGMAREREERKEERARANKSEQNRSTDVRPNMDTEHSKTQAVYDWLTVTNRERHWKSEAEVPGAREIVSVFSANGIIINPSSAHDGRKRWIRDRKGE